MMNVCIDIHGVLDRFPSAFVKMAKEVRAAGGKVHVVTGMTLSHQLILQLLSYGSGEQFWDELVSIEDCLTLSGKGEGQNEFGRPMFPAELWNSFKGKYCDEHEVDVMFDDSPEYAGYSSALFFLVQGTKFSLKSA